MQLKEFKAINSENWFKPVGKSLAQIGSQKAENLRAKNVLKKKVNVSARVRNKVKKTSQEQMNWDPQQAEVNLNFNEFFQKLDEKLEPLQKMSENIDQAQIPDDPQSENFVEMDLEQLKLNLSSHEVPKILHNGNSDKPPNNLQWF